jgi:hypothetical protein
MVATIGPTTKTGTSGGQSDRPPERKELSKIVHKRVPSIHEIVHTAKRIDKTSASKSFFRHSGGYPDSDVKERIYTLLWATMIHNLERSPATAAAPVGDEKTSVLRDSEEDTKQSDENNETPDDHMYYQLC